jgi:hypothetical protein
MDRRRFLGQAALGLAGLGLMVEAGCRGNQTAEVIKPGDPGMVGSHAAGGETYRPLVEAAVANLLSRHSGGVQQASLNQQGPPPLRICFVAVENKSAEEMRDFKEQIYQQIDTRIVQSQVFQCISRRFVDQGLQQTGLRPDNLFMPENMRTFTAAMEQMGQPFEYLLYATLTSGTTQSNKDYQRDYLLTLEMVNVRTGQYDKESAQLSKGYNVSAGAKISHIFN